jgi:hypothetical protein
MWSGYIPICRRAAEGFTLLIEWCSPYTLHPMTSHPDPRITASYEGEARGVRFACTPADYAQGKMAIRIEKVGGSDGYKGAADRLLDALNARYVGRGHAYIISPSRAALWRALFVGGWDAEMDWRGCGAYGTKDAPLLETPDRLKVTLAEAQRLIKAA